MHSLEPGETPTYSASHQAPTSLQRQDDISIDRYRTGTGNKFNLIMRMTVYMHIWRRIHYIYFLHPMFEVMTNPDGLQV